MTLNSYKDEAKDFLQKINALNEGVNLKNRLVGRRISNVKRCIR